MSLCKSVCFIRGRGERVFVSSELGSVWRDMLVPVCFSASFCGLNLRTVPQLNLNKFRAPLGYRGLVLGLNVGKPKRALILSFFGTSNGARGGTANSTKRKSQHRLRHIKKLRAVHHLGHLFLCLPVVVFFLVFFRCRRWCNITGQRSCSATFIAATPQHTVFLREKRKETQLWWVHTIAEVDCRNFPKFQIFATFERMTEWQKCV